MLAASSLELPRPCHHTLSKMLFRSWRSRQKAAVGRERQSAIYHPTRSLGVWNWWCLTHKSPVDGWVSRTPVAVRSTAESHSERSTMHVRKLPTLLPHPIWQDSRTLRLEERRVGQWGEHHRSLLGFFPGCSVDSLLSIRPPAVAAASLLDQPLEYRHQQITAPTVACRMAALGPGASPDIGAPAKTLGPSVPSRMQHAICRLVLIR